MTGFVYPRLPLWAATDRFLEIEKRYLDEGLTGVAALADTTHEQAAPVPTGGPRITIQQLQDIQAAVRSALETWLANGPVPRSGVARFDRELGRVLHSNLQIIPADASHSEAWNFISLVLFPDIAVARFSKMHQDRMLGGARNALRRTWYREEVLGEVLHLTENPLGEDELVGLFERSALARNRDLLRIQAKAVTAFSGNGSRMDWARALYKEVTFCSGPRVLDALAPDALELVVQRAVEKIGPNAPPK